MRKYSYDGPVMEFNTCIAQRWRAETYAVSEQKAKNNLTYQFKKSHDRLAGAKITLPGSVMTVR